MNGAPPGGYGTLYRLPAVRSPVLLAGQLTDYNGVIHIVFGEWMYTVISVTDNNIPQSADVYMIRTEPEVCNGVAQTYC